MAREQFLDKRPERAWLESDARARWRVAIRFPQGGLREAKSEDRNHEGLATGPDLRPARLP